MRLGNSERRYKRNLPFSPSDSRQSVTWRLENLKKGDEASAESLWRRYFQRLTGLARQRLGEGQRRMQDEDDIALSVFKSLCQRAERGDLNGLDGRDELWKGELAS